MRIEAVTEVTPHIHAALARLLPQLNSRLPVPSAERLQRIIDAKVAGEEVVVQFLLIRRHGGCGILPSGTYHLELETTLPDRSSSFSAELGSTP